MPCFQMSFAAAGRRRSPAVPAEFETPDGERDEEQGQVMIASKRLTSWNIVCHDSIHMSSSYVHSATLLIHCFPSNITLTIWMFMVFHVAFLS